MLCFYTSHFASHELCIWINQFNSIGLRTKIIVNMTYDYYTTTILNDWI
jgi:hypothetical protein